MTPTIVLTLVKYAILALLWIFILVAVRVIRADLFGASAATRAPAQAPAAEPHGGRRRSQARRLVVTEGGLQGTSLDLGEREVTLGRADESTLVLTDDYASNHHARLLPGDGVWLLEDLGSTNGTYLGRERVGGTVPVPLGAQIRIGKTVLELRR